MPATGYESSYYVDTAVSPSRYMSILDEYFAPKDEIAFIQNFYSASKKIWIPHPVFRSVMPKRRILQYRAKY